MRKPIILSTFVFLVFLLTAFSSKSPQINLETSAFDFGDVVIRITAQSRAPE
jgi:hypothetical protein